MRILVVDDDAAVARALGRLATSVGFEATVATSPDAALDAIRQCAHDLVLVDENLGADYDGVALLRLCRALSPRTARVLVSGGTIEGLGDALRSGTVERFVPKPVELADVSELRTWAAARIG